MADIEKILKAVAARDVGEATISVVVQPSAPESDLLAWLRGYLRENPAHILELQVHRPRPGDYRLAVAVTATSLERAWGRLGLEPQGASADLASGDSPDSPGHRPRLYRCPKCSREVSAVPLDNIPPPMCINVHSPTRMTPG
jgi:hypothetical protein